MPRNKGENYGENRGKLPGKVFKVWEVLLHILLYV